MFCLIPVQPFTTAYLFRDHDQMFIHMGEDLFSDKFATEKNGMKLYSNPKKFVPDYMAVEVKDRFELRVEIEKVSKYLKWPEFKITVLNRMHPVPHKDFAVVCEYKIMKDHSVVLLEQS